MSRLCIQIKPYHTGKGAGTDLDVVDGPFCGRSMRLFGPDCTDGQGTPKRGKMWVYLLRSKIQTCWVEGYFLWIYIVDHPRKVMLDDFISLD